MQVCNLHQPSWFLLNCIWLYLFLAVDLSHLCLCISPSTSLTCILHNLGTFDPQNKLPSKYLLSTCSWTKKKKTFAGKYRHTHTHAGTHMLAARTHMRLLFNCQEKVCLKFRFCWLFWPEIVWVIFSHFYPLSPFLSPFLSLSQARINKHRRSCKIKLKYE